MIWCPCTRAKNVTKLRTVVTGWDILGEGIFGVQARIWMEQLIELKRRNAAQGQKLESNQKSSSRRTIKVALQDGFLWKSIGSKTNIEYFRISAIFWQGFKRRHLNHYFRL